MIKIDTTRCIGCRRGIYPWLRNKEGGYEHFDLFGSQGAASVYACLNSKEIEPYLNEDANGNGSYVPNGELKAFLEEEQLWFDDIVDLAFDIFEDWEKVKLFFESGEEGCCHWQLERDALEEVLFGLAYGKDITREDYPFLQKWKDSTVETRGFTDHEWNHMHDCILHCTWDTTKKKCTREELQAVFQTIPEELKSEAQEFGMNDTLWRDNFIEWFQEQDIWKF